MNRTASLFEEEKLKLFDVAIPLPFADAFTYSAPQNLENFIQVGCRVLVPFKNRTIVGFVVALDSQKDVESPKKILEVLDENPILATHHLAMAKWVSEYYFSGWGEAIGNMVPKFARKKRTQKTTAKSKQESGHSVSSKIEISKPFELTQEQSVALEKIVAAVRLKQFSEFFLYGVTGAGKSEVYIRAIEEVLSAGGGVICLVPEIAITEQLKHFFLKHFHMELEILHSKLTESARAEAWRRIRSGEKRVVLGARSAVFAPVENLRLIIMDEEQEGSYKQDKSPRYHAREVARWRAQALQIPFLMGTATPTLETMHRAKGGEVELLMLSKRIDGRPMPEVCVVDLKQAESQSGKTMILSHPLRQEMERALLKGNGILILLNRRGFSTLIRCASCMKTFYCTSCAVPLTFHQEEQKLICHYCNYQEQIPSQCPKCKKNLIKFFGLGTERIESEIARHFPGARIARLDADTTKTRGAHERIISGFRAQDIDILIGTQMIAKGFDFHHVTVVGIINADTGLMLPDFRAGERTFQLLTQMAGRTGRGTQPGKVVIQTYSPTHYSIERSSKHDYFGFFEEELSHRKKFFYPPFSRLINILFRGRKEKMVEGAAREFSNQIAHEISGTSIQIVGPAQLPMYRLRGQFRWHVMVKDLEMSSLNQAILKALAQTRKFSGVFTAVDVDPMAIL